MKDFIRLAGVLLLVAGIAAGVLAATYQVTAPEIAAGEKREKANALRSIFFNGYAREELKTAAVNGAAVEYFAVYLHAGDSVPDYYALSGKGLGYNKSVPIELLVGFVNPAKKDVPLPGGEKYNAAGTICAGWKVVKSQETPGLGENAKQEQAAFTWWEFITGNRPPAAADRRTAFQKQFAGKVPAAMEAKKNIDIITGATYSTQGIVSAIQDAESKLAAVLKP